MNLPGVQNVTGSVAVSNLPVDASGNLMVAAPAFREQIVQLVASPLTLDGGLPCWWSEPVLAAGYDKEGRWASYLARLGFGFVEVGTVTPRPQSGNPPPRLFRFPDGEALVNRMGFNNPGADEVARNLALSATGRERRALLGVNVGKQRETPVEEASRDYRETVGKLSPLADYLVINILYSFNFFVHRTGMSRLVWSFNMYYYQIMCFECCQGTFYLSSVIIIQTIGYPRYLKAFHSDHTPEPM